MKLIKTYTHEHTPYSVRWLYKCGRYEYAHKLNIHMYGGFDGFSLSEWVLSNNYIRVPKGYTFK